MKVDLELRESVREFVPGVELALLNWVDLDPGPVSILWVAANYVVEAVALLLRQFSF